MRAAVFLAVALSAAGAAADELPPAGSDESRKEEALRSFRRGLDLSAAGAWDAALLEFLRSRAAYSTRNATRNAANSLRKLGRYDEAHALCEAVLREFPEMSSAERADVERDVADLAALTGMVVLRGAVGATLSVDGRDRGAVSAPPVRLSAGGRKLRVSRTGFAAWERAVDVPAQGVLELDVVLEPLPVHPPPPAPVTRDRLVVREVDRPASPPRASIEVAGGPAFGPGLGAGGLVQVRVGYDVELPLSIGLSAGYARVGRDEQGPSTITPFGGAANPGASEDALLLHGGLAGLFGALRWEHVTLRIGAGALIGRASIRRTGSFRSSTGEPYPIGVDPGATWANYLFLAPEARVGFRVAGPLELSVGSAPLLLAALSQPSVDATEEVVNPDAFATVTIDRDLAPPVTVLLTIDVGVRVSF